MAIEVTMPKLSDTMEDGKILRWLKKTGERVAKGDVLAEVETDKADMELEADQDGVLDKILVEEGSSAAVGDVIAVLSRGDGGADADGDGGRAASAAKPKREGDGDEDGPASTAKSESKDEDEDAAAGSDSPEPARARSESRPRPPGPRPRGAAGGTDGRGSQEADGAKPRLRAASTPAPRESAAASPQPEERPQEQEAKGDAAPPSVRRGREGRREELSNVRRTVARRMAESKRDVPHFYITAEIRMAEAGKVKESLAAALPDGPAVSYTHILLRAVAIALRKHPRINARYAGEGAIEHPDGIHLGVAVAAEQGLIVAVVHDCADKALLEIAQDTRQVVERVRAGKPHGDDLSGGTFTISNLGMFPIDEFAAVINPPQAAVLAVGALVERPLARDGKVVIEPTMKVTLSSDHRVIDGAEAADFLRTLKGLLENPVQLLL
ncbi:MAG: hypothetical protein QOD06_390 [Candidatus Binatota bacterium]|jgi:pyruvate dehydrogenase E2 component (dihydrolipoamide acetyltransferase)|nr:hypothetical protein [Candidatus Binatota bacterium]